MAEVVYASAWMTTLAAAVGAAVYSLVLVGVEQVFARRRVSARDHRGLALIAGLLLAAWVSRHADKEFAQFALVALGVFFVWAALLTLTDRLKLPRGLRALAVVLLLAALAALSVPPPVSSFKLPFATKSVALGMAGWVVSWVWLTLFGSMFARAGTILGVVPSLTVLSGLTFAAIAALRPDLVSVSSKVVALGLAAAGLGVGPFERRIRHPAASAGAYAVGVAVAWTAAVCMVKNTALLALLLPLLIVGAPLFAAVAPTAVRRRTGALRPQHLHEVLMDQGYSQAQVAAIAVASAAYLCVLAIVLVVIVEWHWLFKLVVASVWVGTGIFFGFLIVRLMPRARSLSATPVEVRLFGLRLHGLTMDQALEQARAFLRSSEPHYLVTCDASGVVRAQDDEEFREIANSADLVTADGAGVVLASKLLGLPVAVRVAGCDMVEGLCHVAAEEGRSVFFLGAEPGVAEEAAAKLAERVPGLQVAGCRDGYFKPEEEAAVVRQIAALRPGVLFVALGQPRQERFIAAHLREIGAGVAIGIGGSLDVISGRKKRAPVFLQRVGLEWLWRVATEPSRLPRLKALPRIVLMAFRELLRGPAPLDDDARR